MKREATIKRKTSETDIQLHFTIDGKGAGNVSSGNHFMDHLLILFTGHGSFNLDLRCKGDIEIDFHHSIEDIGICLGKAVDEALSDKKGIRRYSTVHIPMDESLSRVSLDICGRSNLIYSVNLIDRKINNFECDLAEDFFKAFTDHSQITMHIDLLRGRNSHHSIESVFKAFGRSLSEACSINPKAGNSIPSTKGII
jgi:imidazoleglycerol-phosphate dehydratase